MTVWHEVVIEGSEKALRAFILGFATTHPGRGAMLLGTDVDLAPTSLSERLHELFAAGTHHLVLAPAATAAEIAAALGARGEDVGLRVDGVREVLGARLPFAIRAFSPAVAQTLRGQLLAALPDGVVVSSLEESEDVDPSSKGAELYAPSHDYVFRAEGAFEGSLPGVLEMQRRARALEFVNVGELTLSTRGV